MGKGGHGHGHSSDDDDHADPGTPFDQRLEEVSFLRSACAAAQKGDAARLERLLDRCPSQLHDDGAGGGGGGGLTPLHYAAREGRAACVHLLLERGAGVGARSAGGATPLHRAAFTGQLEVVALLLSVGADAAAVDGDGQTALHKAKA